MLRLKIKVDKFLKNILLFFSYLKPSFAHLIWPGESEWDKKHLQVATLLNRRRFRVPELESYIPYPILLEAPKAPPTYKIR